MKGPMQSRLLKGAIVLFVVFQVTVSSLALMGPRPGRFGWQMFTGSTPVPAVWVESESGSLEPVDIDRLIAYGRPEVDFTSALVRSLCGEADVAGVVIEVDGGRSRFACDG